MNILNSEQIKKKYKKINEAITSLLDMVDDIFKIADEIRTEEFSDSIRKIDEDRSLVYDAIDTLDEQLYSYAYDAEEAAKEIEASSEEDDNACLLALYRDELAALAYDYRYR